MATKIDCVVELAYVEELLGGRSVDEQLDDPRTGGLVEQCDERLVLSISEEMQAALASLPDAELPQIARMWAQAEEFEGAADPAHLELVLRDLRALSQTATERTLGLYCWACVQRAGCTRGLSCPAPGFQNRTPTGTQAHRCWAT